jgi:AraC-like DNA-binding protein
MNIFLTKDNNIIDSHLNHVLKSYYYTTGYSIYAYTPTGQLIDKETKEQAEGLIDYINHLSQKIVPLIHNSSFLDKDFLLYEIFKNIYTIVAPVKENNRLIMYLMIEPFIITNLSTYEKKCYYKSFFKNCEISIPYLTFINFPYIHSNRINYLGQLFYHLMSNGIYIGEQHSFPKLSMEQTKWGKCLPLDSFEYTQGFINYPILKQICDYLVIKDIDNAIKTYCMIQMFSELPCNDSCIIKIYKYQLISLTVIIQYHLSNYFKDMTSQLHEVSTKCIKSIDKHCDYIILNQFGESIIREFYNVIKKHNSKELSPNIYKVLEYIHNNYMKNIKLSDIAQSIPMNESYLSTQFRQEYDMPLKQYLNQYRINQATILIKNSNYNLTQIALKVGFESTNYFSTVFKKYNHLTPRQYYKKYHNTNIGQQIS